MAGCKATASRLWCRPRNAAPSFRCWPRPEQPPPKKHKPSLRRSTIFPNRPSTSRPTVDTTPIMWASVSNTRRLDNEQAGAFCVLRTSVARRPNRVGRLWSRATKHTDDVWHVESSTAAAEANGSIDDAVRRLNHSMNGSSRCSSWRIVFGIAELRTIKHNCWRRCSHINYSFAITTAVDAQTAKYGGFSIRYEFPDTLK